MPAVNDSSHVYTTSAPGILAAYLAASNAWRAAVDRAAVDAEQIRDHAGVAVRGATNTIALKPADPDRLPAGWRLIGAGHLVPDLAPTVSGDGTPDEVAASRAAVAWVEDHELPPDPRRVPGEHGLAFHDRHNGRRRLPGMHLRDGELWVHCGGAAEVEVTGPWARRTAAELGESLAALIGERKVSA